ncbi:MAG: substrate-binding domain-containing protein, partial [Paludibacteraceae bacterium]|nr:substrate-binding domain-containing protein [Paludibacteraceae bacterium]
MKKTSITALVIALSLILTAAAVSCLRDGEKLSYTIGLSQCADDAWRRKMNQEMQMELLFHPEMKLEVLSADDDSRKQSADIDYFISKKVDLLIVSPNEANGVTDAVSRAYDAGIPVIVADRRVNGDKYTAFIGGDNVQVGVLMAKEVEKLLPEGGKVV